MQYKVKHSVLNKLLLLFCLVVILAPTIYFFNSVTTIKITGLFDGSELVIRILLSLFIVVILLQVLSNMFDGYIKKNMLYIRKSDQVVFKRKDFERVISENEKVFVESGPLNAQLEIKQLNKRKFIVDILISLPLTNQTMNFNEELDKLVILTEKTFIKELGFFPNEVNLINTTLTVKRVKITGQ